jgi:hypothetical protein
MKQHLFTNDNDDGNFYHHPDVPVKNSMLLKVHKRENLFGSDFKVYYYGDLFKMTSFINKYLAIIFGKVR